MILTFYSRRLQNVTGEAFCGIGDEQEDNLGYISALIIDIIVCNWKFLNW